MPKNYQSYSKDELIKELQHLKKQKKYGLVWEEDKHKEDVVESCKTKLPILKEVKGKEIITDKDKPTNILIEGDNYHALSVLNYTHEKKIDVIYIDPPYNTGAKDWKYNNDYVDINNAYRHSKWLSMMANRLRITRRLLKDNGVLICAIDDNEFYHLGVLLEEVFKGYEIHCITIVHNPRGIQGKNFSYTHEYAYFVFRKDLKVIGDRKIRDEDIWWSNLRNWGGESLREDARNCFYPVLIEDDRIVGFGDVVVPDTHPEKQTIKKGNKYYVYPIDKKGIERKWRYARQSVEEIKDLLRAKKTKTGYEIEIGKDFGTVRTVWQDSRYDANEYGTKLVHSLVSGTDFDFPKSLFNTYDCIAPILYERKKAIVLDYFAGSGTTGHAVMLLNKEDGGDRQFILCTNNENKIAEEVCYPRIKNVIKGHRDYPDITGVASNLKYFRANEDSFIDAQPTDKNKVKLTRQAIEMLCIREDTFQEVIDTKEFKVFKNNKHHTGIIFDQLAIQDFKKAIKNIGPIRVDNGKENKNSRKFQSPASDDSNGVNKFSVYVFSLGDDTFDEEFEDMKQKVKLSPIPEAILRVYRRIFK